MNDTAALGLVEVYGLTSAIAAADAMAKGAPVEMLERQQIGDGLVTVVARGGVSAVREAVEAGRRVAEHSASLRSAAVLGRPAAGVAELFFPPVIPNRSPSVRRIRATRPSGAQSRKRGGTQIG